MPFIVYLSFILSFGVSREPLRHSIYFDIDEPYRVEEVLILILFIMCDEQWNFKMLVYL